MEKVNPKILDPLNGGEFNCDERFVKSKANKYSPEKMDKKWPQKYWIP